MLAVGGLGAALVLLLVLVLADRDGRPDAGPPLDAPEPTTTPVSRTPSDSGPQADGVSGNVEPKAPAAGEAASDPPPPAVPGNVASTPAAGEPVRPTPSSAGSGRASGGSHATTPRSSTGGRSGAAAAVAAGVTPGVAPGKRDAARSGEALEAGTVVGSSPSPSPVGDAESVGDHPVTAVPGERAAPGGTGDPARAGEPADGMPEEQQTAPRVWLVPSATELGVGEGLVVVARISSATDVGHAPFYLTYDTGVLEFVRAEEGGFLGGDGAPTAFFATATGGAVVVGLSRLGQVGGVGGEGELCSFRFTAIAPGAAGLGFTRASVRDSGNRILPAEFLRADVVVR